MMDEAKQPNGAQEPMIDSAQIPHPPEGEPSTTDGAHYDSEMPSMAGEAQPHDVQDAVSDPIDVLGTDADQGDMGGIDYRVAVSELTKQIENLKAQLDDRNGQYMRIVADFDNFRKRTQREKEEMEQQIKCSTVVELLPVVDNFERARTQLKPQSDSEMNMHKSYQGVYKDLVERLKRIGVSPMRAEGREFDPNLHEAVMREPTEAFPEGTVMEELVRGYMLGDRVLRHAMVKVAAAPEPVVASEEDRQGSE